MAVKNGIKTGQIFDVDAMQREIYAASIKATPPRVAPVQLERIIKYLEKMTDVCVAHEQKLSAKFGVNPAPYEDELFVLEGIRSELSEWRAKLTIYRTSVSQCMATGRSEDIDCTMWSVVAPLFYGIFDGPLGTSKPRTPDLRTALMIGNQLGALEEFVETDSIDAWRYLSEETGRVFVGVGETTAGLLRLMATVSGEVAGNAGGGLIAGLGPVGIGAVALVAAILFWPKKGGA